MITPFVALFIFSFMQFGGGVWGVKAVVIWNTCVSAKPWVRLGSTPWMNTFLPLTGCYLMSSLCVLCHSGECVRGVCRGDSEELSTIKQSGHNVKPSDLLSNPCLTELCSTLESEASGPEEQLVYRWTTEEGKWYLGRCEDTFWEKRKKKIISTANTTGTSMVEF